MKGVVSAVLVGAAVATHYEKPPCQADEMAGQLSTGTQLCAPKCDASGACPTDVPSGATAQPQCALKTTGGDKYCALVCQKASDCGTGGADCTKPVPFMPTGVCTYATGLAAPTPSSEQDKFDEFAAAFGRVYTSAEEREKRFVIFVENLASIVKMQGLDSSATYSHKTPFADWSVEEFSARNNLDLSLFKQTVTEQAEVKNNSLPDAFDWREKGAVNDVKNQGQCGSCWAFSTVANIEGVNFVKTQKLVSLSEQELVDCDHSGDEGCQGGLPSNAFKYMIAGKVGLELEDKYPYVGTRGGNCQQSKSDELVFISNWKQISTDENVMAAALIQYGPLSIGINAGPMQWYGGGVADPFNLLCNPKSIDHGVAIVGFGTSAAGLLTKSKPYWTIRNSWGASWGEKGYYRIVRGVNKCGLTSMVTTSVIGDATVVV